MSGSRYQHLLIPIREVVAKTGGLGLSEFELLEALAEMGVPEFQERDYQDVMALFRVHFVLFHCLYLLRHQLVERGRMDLEITCMRIRMIPRKGSKTTALSQLDNLQLYYLDLKNLDHADESEVEAMLGGFWRQMKSRDKRVDALKILDLTEGVSEREIKEQYRRLAMRAHPDRGGSHDEIQRINEAYKILQEC